MVHIKRVIVNGFLLILIAFICSTIGIAWDGLTDEVQVVDLAVVPGNKVELDGRPSSRLQARLDKAVDLYNQGYVSKILVSGAVGSEGFDEAVVMQHYLIEQGVPTSHVYVDSRGSTTRETARHSAQLMETHNLHSSVVISQYFHIARSKLALRQFGVDPVYGAHANYFEWRDIYAMLREVVAFYSYLLRRST